MIKEPGYKRAQEALTAPMKSGEEFCIAVQKDDKGGKLAIPSWTLVREATRPLGGRLPSKPPKSRQSYIEVPNLPNVTILRASSEAMSTLLADRIVRFAFMGLDRFLEDAPEGARITVPLGIARSSLVLMARRNGLIRNIEDIKGNTTVATPFKNLTTEFLDTNNITPRRVVKLKSSEGAVASGGYDVGAELVQTGASMLADGLIQLEGGKILDAEAVLAESV